MFIKQHWNDYSYYFDLERERERHTVERVGQDKDDLLDHWEKVLLEGIFLILCAITPILCKIEFK